MIRQTVTVRKILPATCEEVFDAWLDPEGLREWMRPGLIADCDVTLEPRIGGEFRIVMKGPDVETINTGRFLVLDRPVRLVLYMDLVALEERGNPCDSGTGPEGGRLRDRPDS